MAAFAPPYFSEPELKLGQDRWGLGQIPGYQEKSMSKSGMLTRSGLRKRSNSRP